jgi:hypothetical protein
MTTAPPSFAAEYRPKGDRGFWRLLAVRPSERACWDELLAAPNLRTCDLRVRPLLQRITRFDERPYVDGRGSAPLPCPPADFGRGG